MHSDWITYWHNPPVSSGIKFWTKWMHLWFKLVISSPQFCDKLQPPKKKHQSIYFLRKRLVGLLSKLETNAILSNWVNESFSKCITDTARQPVQPYYLPKLTRLYTGLFFWYFYLFLSCTESQPVLLYFLYFYSLSARFKADIFIQTTVTGLESIHWCEKESC